MNVLSSTPIIGGVFSAVSGIWAEKDQKKTNDLLIKKLEHFEDEALVKENALVSKDNPSHIYAGFIKFNPNTSNIIDSSKISSLCDNGTLNFKINFIVPIDKHIFNFYGDGPLKMNSIIETTDGLRVTFSAPCPDLVTIIFYELL